MAVRGTTAATVRAAFSLTGLGNSSSGLKAKG